MRSRNSLMRERREAFRDARLIVIASEGIERARALDKNPTDRWPQTLGTRVYLLAESVMNRK